MNHTAEATITPGRVERAQAAHAAAQEELVAALREDLANRAAAAYPEPAWLIVDPEKWRDSPDEWGIELRAVIGADGQVLHDHQRCQWGLPHPEGRHHTEVHAAIENRLTEIANLDGISGWPEVCSVISWDCALSAVPLTVEATMRDCHFPHDDHDEWDDE